MPQLKYLFKNAITPEYRMLRGKTMECISLIGLAVGKDKVCSTIHWKWSRSAFEQLILLVLRSLSMIVMKLCRSSSKLKLISRIWPMTIHKWLIWLVRGRGSVKFLAKISSNTYRSSWDLFWKQLLSNLKWLFSQVSCRSIDRGNLFNRIESNEFFF